LGYKLGFYIVLVISLLHLSLGTPMPRAPFQERANIAKAGQKPFALNINDLWKKAIDDEQFA
jgi:hypothetical protein